MMERTERRDGTTGDDSLEGERTNMGGVVDQAEMETLSVEFAKRSMDDGRHQTSQGCELTRHG